MLYKQIPNIKPLEIYKNNNFIDEELIEIDNHYGFIIEMKYPLMNMHHAINKCLIRKEVLNKLLQAKTYLPEGITFKIWDAYRPLSLQKEIYQRYKNDIIINFDLQNLSKQEQNKYITKYISLPTENEIIPPLHTTGGSIDLTLAYIDTKKELDIGVDFDEFSNLTASTAFEKPNMNKTIRKNRCILYNAMIQAGFTNLPSEIWHYDYGNRAWAFYKNKKAIYKGIFNIK